MRPPLRRSDDADVIRARLRVLLAQGAAPVPGWLPGDDPADPGSGAAAAQEDAAQEDAGGTAHGTPLPDPPEERALPQGLGRHRAPGPATRWDPGRGGARSLWIAAVLTVAGVLGWTWLERPVVEPAAAPAEAAGDPAPPPVSAPAAGGEEAGTASRVVVSVVGQVTRPGLVTLGPGARVADAVAAAGGFAPEADPASVNLAAPVRDGEQVTVGMPAGPGATGPVPGGVPAGVGGVVDLNAAGVADLDALPGIGPVLAQSIVDHRTRNGPFRSVDELDDVPGIGPAIAGALAELVAV